MTHEEFLQAILKKRAAWLRSLACEAMVQKKVNRFEFGWPMSGEVQALKFHRVAGKCTKILWEDFRTRIDRPANYRDNSQIITCASLGVLNVFYNTWPEEIAFVENVAQYYLTACQLAGRPWTEDNMLSVPDYQED